MKRKFNIALSLLWIAVVYGQFFFMRSQLKFPTFDLHNGGLLVIAFMTASFWGLVFALLATEKRKIFRIFSSVFIVIGIAANLFCTCCTTFFFSYNEPGLYPLYSETKNPDDYLELDDRFESNYEYIIKYVPSEIPKEAENVIYEYYYNSIKRGILKVSWSLPESEYNALKNETLKKDGEITYTKNLAIFSTYWNITDIPAYWTGLTVEFDDNAKTASYAVSQVYCE